MKETGGGSISEEVEELEVGGPWTLKSISPEEAEVLTFVPSAIGEPRGAIYFCDNRCSEKSVRYWQFASVVVEGGEEARTGNFSQQCFNERQVQQPRLNSWQ